MLVFVTGTQSAEIMAERYKGETNACMHVKLTASVAALVQMTTKSEAPTGKCTYLCLCIYSVESRV